MVPQSREKYLSLSVGRLKFIYSFQHYYTTPGLAWDAALRMSRVDLQLITNIDMYHFAENGIRGGISMSSTRHAQANSNSYPDTYDSSFPNQNLIYLDANNLYGRAMFQIMPPQRKFTANLRDKDKYVVHYRNLKLYLQLGLVVTKVHRVLTFRQSAWLKTYIDFNTRQRSLAGYSFLTYFFKLMNNSVFGKTQENLRNRVSVELITDARILRKRIAKPNFYRGSPITDYKV